MNVVALPTKRRRRRRSARTILSPVIAEARRRRRELNAYLSTAISEELGFSVKVTVQMDPPASPDMKRVLKAGVRKTSKALFSELFNKPL